MIFSKLCIGSGGLASAAKASIGPICTICAARGRSGMPNTAAYVQNPPARAATTARSTAYIASCHRGRAASAQPLARQRAVLPRGARAFSRVAPPPPPRLFSARRCETASNEAISNLQGDETAMALRCAILDDYQNVALKLGDWPKLKSDVEF